MPHFHPSTTAPEEVTSYPQNIHDMFNFKGIVFPVKLRDIHKFEEQNPSISINVFAYNKTSSYIDGPIYMTSKQKENHINNICY